MSIITPLIVVSLIITFGYFGCLVSYLTDYEIGQCDMTYMFEYPQFVQIHTKVDDEFKGRYGLYAYSEGQLTKKARDMYFNGIPVLFIPGSGGSYKQVRSLASIALRKSLNSRTGYHFNYFTVDLNEEINALNGGLLFEQFYYVNKSIYRTLELYEKRATRPKSIILVGHSMGGVLASAILSAQSPSSSLISIIIYLAAPLSRPPLLVDYQMQHIYQIMTENRVLRKRTTEISIAGGFNDFLIPTFLTTKGHVNALSTGVPKCWLTVDHLSILWCKQLVLAINRALFDSVDLKTKQITLDTKKRMQIFKHHLVKNSGINIRTEDKYLAPISINNQGQWIESMYRQYTVRLPNGTRDTKWYMFPLKGEVQYEHLTLLAVNLKNTDWLFVCPAINVRGNSRVCDDGSHLTHLSEIFPSIRSKRRILSINMFDLKTNFSKSTHVVVKVMPTDDPVVLHIDMHNSKERTIEVNSLPKWYTFRSQVIIEETAEHAINYILQLPHLTHVIQSYQVYVEPMKCTEKLHHASVSLSAPWDQDSHRFVTETDNKKPLNMRLHSSRPLTKPDLSASLHLVLDPACRYKISIKDTIHYGNLARFYSPTLVANVAAILMLALRSQLQALFETEKCPTFFTALNQGAKPYYIVTAVKVATKILCVHAIIFSVSMPDGLILVDENLDFLLLSLLSFLVSLGIVWMLALGLAVALVFFESTFHKLALKFLTKTIARSTTLSDYFMNAFQKLPEAVSVILIVLCLTTCGGLALWLGTAFYFLRLVKMSQDIIEDLVWSIVKAIGKDLKRRLGIFKKKPKEQVNPAIEDKSDESVAIEDKPEEAETDAVKVDGDDASETVDVETKTEDGTEDVIEDNSDDNKDVNEIKEDVDKVEDVIGEDDTETKTENQPMDLKSILLEAITNDEIYFHFTLFLIYFVTACINVPYVLTWAHNYKHQMALKPDPSFIPCIALCACTLPLWRYKFPRVNLLFYCELSTFTYLCCVFVLMYGTMSIYRINYVLANAVVLVVVHQLFSPNKDDMALYEDEEDGDDDVNRYKEKVKTKLE